MRPEAAQLGRDRFDAVGLLLAQLLRATQTTLASSHRGDQRIERQLVHEGRHLPRLDRSGHELRVRDAEVGNRLAAGRAPVEDRDARAHPLQHVQEPRSRRVDADAGQDQLGSGQQGGSGEERGGSREVSRHVHALEQETLDRRDRDATRLDA